MRIYSGPIGSESFRRYCKSQGVRQRVTFPIIAAC
jgi:hypothetical protein